jgi:hypothetical protein|tara:strand:+ start:78 stop:311 length:234 start_codon:yes stop_codon:yes gene_type:complete
MKLDLKSFLIGALSVVCFVLITGAKDSHEGEVGRYQVALTAPAIAGSNWFVESIIDTKTGEITKRNRLHHKWFKKPG